MTTVIWAADARTIDVSEFDIEKYVAKTTRVRDFIDGGKTIVAAPKGYGKTLLLKYIYHVLTKNKPAFFSVPFNNPIDSFEFEISLDEKKIKYLSESTSWESLWLTSIGLSIILNYAYETDDALLLMSLLDRIQQRPSRLSSIIAIIKMVQDAIEDQRRLRAFERAQFNPTSILVLLLANNLGSLRSGLDWLGDAIYQFSLGVEKNIYVFIDQIDQAIRSYPLKVWQEAQVGFVGAVYRLYLSNKHLKIFGSIRKEAWDFRSDELSSQYKDCVCELTYTFEEMQEIFAKGILTYEKDLSEEKPELFREDPITAFLGIEEYENTWAGQKERPFAYMFRHTIRRPRDLILIGERIHQLLAQKNLSLGTFVEAVNDIPGDEIHSQYMNEAERFTSSIATVDFEKLFNLINKNVYTRAELVDICSTYNRELECIVKSRNGDCRDCLGATHIFSDLYRIGLLGVLDRDPKKSSSPFQHFELAGRVRSKNLPESEYYLLHPGLEYCIKSIHGNKRYSPVRGILIGYRELWPARYDALMFLHNIDIYLRQSGITSGSPLISETEKLAMSIMNEAHKSSEFSAQLKKYKTSITTDGLLSSSQFLTNICSCLDQIFKFANYMQ